MRTAGLLMLCVLCGPRPAPAGEIPVTGRVTYLSSGIIYTSLGRAQGLRDSALLRVHTGRDTAALLRVFALSSHSSACSLVAGRIDFRVGASVTAYVPLPEPPVVDSTGVAVPTGTGLRDERKNSPGNDAGRVERSTGFIVKGRISSQFRMLRYDAGDLDLRQPGLVMNLQARASGVPLTADLYANLRTASSGNSPLFGRSAVNQSRVYRAALSYDAESMQVILGRTGVPGAPAVGMIDGGVALGRFRSWGLGVALGYQPNAASRGVSTEYTKAVVFGSYESPGALRGAITAAYARVYYGRQLDRESILGGLALSLPSSLSVYGNAEVDLRRKAGENFTLRPALSSLVAHVAYPALPFLTVGLGVDAVRPVYSYAAVRSLPDVLLERALSWGASLTVGVQIPGGLLLSNTTALRPGGSRREPEYADYATLSMADVAGTGITLRSNLNTNHSRYATSLGYGGGIQTSLLTVMDVTLRHQQYGYTITRSGKEMRNSTTGVDAVVSLGASVALYGSYEWTTGYGPGFRSLFTELSVRF